VALTACNRQPEWYRVPEQRKPMALPAAPAISPVVNMNDPDAPDHFVKDISSGVEAATWRWTGKRPTVKILLTKTTGLKYVIDFAIAGVTLKQTGPVTVSFFVADRLLDKARYETEGNKHFEKPVDSDWLQTATETEVSAEVDREFVSPEDGTKLGLILTRIGFDRQ